ncbi:hypothetical protein ABZ419_32070 [Streptomyces cinnamoneus]|uniref:hypothetical protein n=1 Tax=Streptomyces cinnamoneus TaxID=53446 RepID=UPI0033CD1CBF
MSIELKSVKYRRAGWVAGLAFAVTAVQMSVTASIAHADTYFNIKTSRNPWSVDCAIDAQGIAKIGLCTIRENRFRMDSEGHIISLSSNGCLTAGGGALPFWRCDLGYPEGVRQWRISAGSDGWGQILWKGIDPDPRNQYRNCLARRSNNRGEELTLGGCDDSSYLTYWQVVHIQ